MEKCENVLNKIFYNINLENITYQTLVQQNLS